MIGNKIRERREELGWTQEELAEKMGYKSISTIAKIESGKNDVTQKNIVKFADVMNVSISYLMEWENKTIGADIEPYRTNENNKHLVAIYKEVSKMDEKKLVTLLAFLKSMNGDNDYES